MSKAVQRRGRATQEVGGAVVAGFAYIEGCGVGKMVSPERKRRAVDRAQKELGVPERPACQTLGQSRSTQRYRARLPDKDAGIGGAVASDIEEASVA